MDVTQITAIIGASASLLCTLVVGALTYFIKKTLVSLEEADKRNAADIREEERKREQDIKDLSGQLNDLKSDMPLVYTLREDFIRSMNSVDHNMSELGQKLDRVLNLISSQQAGRKEG